MLALVLALQLSNPCPPSLSCTMPLPMAETVTPVTVIADPERPAKWFTTAMSIELAVFETWALASHHDTVSQWTQDESREHHAIRWLGVAAMAALTWHLFWGFDD